MCREIILNMGTVYISKFKGRENHIIFPGLHYHYSASHLVAAKYYRQKKKNLCYVKKKLKCHVNFKTITKYLLLFLFLNKFLYCAKYASRSFIFYLNIF